MKMRGYRTAGMVLVIAGALCRGVTADLLFEEDFQSDLSAWTGKYNGAHHGALVEDPLNLGSGNYVLKFTETASGGDIFTKEIFSAGRDTVVTVSFDYLGLVEQDAGQRAGGFAGLSAGLPGDHHWYAGTGEYPGGLELQLRDNREWNSYEYTFTVPMDFGNSFHLMFEDFRKVKGPAGDAYFDNITVHTAPVPGAALLGILGLGVGGLRLRRRRA